MNATANDVTARGRVATLTPQDVIFDDLREIVRITPGAEQNRMDHHRPAVAVSVHDRDARTDIRLSPAVLRILDPAAVDLVRVRRQTTPADPRIGGDKAADRPRIALHCVRLAHAEAADRDQRDRSEKR